MNPHLALNPQLSVVVEACAGSGKTWLLVSRMVRLLLDGVAPSQILAITFTRKAAQEMRSRLQLWLRDLAMGDDEFVCEFFAARGLSILSTEQIQRARSLYHQVLLAQPPLSISTFHGWFMQVLQRAPLDAGVMSGNLLERAGSTQDEVWEGWLEHLRVEPESPASQHLHWLFAECGLSNTQELLSCFLAKRAEWWAFINPLTAPIVSGESSLEFALRQLRVDLQVDMAAEPAAEWGADPANQNRVFDFIQHWIANGSEVQKRNASDLERAWTDSACAARFSAIWQLLFTLADKPRKIKANKKQDELAFDRALQDLQTAMQAVRDALAEQQAYRLNTALFYCGIEFLEAYQTAKQQQQAIDFADLEWQLCHLLQHSEHAETMQFKLDSRYRHVLLDEFQDTNPLQWQILRAWFDASLAVQSPPSVFVVGDPKQSIYRFRRADARLFKVARDYLVENFAAEYQTRNHTRRNAPAILQAVNTVFASHPQGFDHFVAHSAEHSDLPGFVTVLPLARAPEISQENAETPLTLRNPLLASLAEKAEDGRALEATQFADYLQEIVKSCVLKVGHSSRLASYGDIMVLVRNRTHLAVYEAALRRAAIPFISSRHGGLLDTLEAEDLQALLLFLMTPFADLALAQVLRSPIFSCQDEDLMALAHAVRTSEAKKSWWVALQQLPEPAPALRHALALLPHWLALADKLPVHDLLDKIYFEGDVIARYQAALPSELRDKVTANLHAFMEIALNMDAGRYPSLPRFCQKMRELRDSREDAPNEGRLGNTGNSVRIYTVHESKGLEAPIICLLDANASRKKSEINQVLISWPTEVVRPVHFSLYTDLASRGVRRADMFAEDAAQQAREEMNLLYVAMTRAQQVLIVSGHATSTESNANSISWYQRIAEALAANQTATNLPPEMQVETNKSQLNQCVTEIEFDTLPALPMVKLVGKCREKHSVAQKNGIGLHALLEHLTESEHAHGQVAPDLAKRLGIPAADFERLLPQAQQLLKQAELSQFFDPQFYIRASNELPYLNSAGELKRIDRLVETTEAVWVLDYKFGEQQNLQYYQAQMAEYRRAMQTIYSGKTVRCALIFAEGHWLEV